MGVEGLPVDPTDLIEGLAIKQTPQLYELDPPKYTSSYGRRTDAVFKQSIPPAPMLFSPDHGLVLYERVISTKAEHELMDKLSKPKSYHAPVSKPSHKGSTGSPATGGKHPLQPHSEGGSPARPPSGRGPGGPSGSLSATCSPRREHQQQRHTTTSVAPGAADSSGSAPRQRQQQQLQDGQLRRKPLYPEKGVLQDYFSKERSSVTASTVFTWGNRYKVGEVGSGTGTGSAAGGGGGGARGHGKGGAGPESGSFKSFMPATHKPPLRL